MDVIKFLKRHGIFNIYELARCAGISYQILQRQLKDGSRKLSDKDLLKLKKFLTKYGYNG